MFIAQFICGYSFAVSLEYAYNSRFTVTDTIH